MISALAVTFLTIGQYAATEDYGSARRQLQLDQAIYSKLFQTEHSISRASSQTCERPLREMTVSLLRRRRDALEERARGIVVKPENFPIVVGGGHIPCWEHERASSRRYYRNTRIARQLMRDADRQLDLIDERSRN